MKIYVSHSKNFDFENKLYKPLRASELNTKHEIFLPHEGEWVDTKESMKSFDLILAEVSEPATGQGIELGRADVYGIPIVCIYEEGKKISNSLKFITEKFVEYKDPQDMVDKVLKIL